MTALLALLIAMTPPPKPQAREGFLLSFGVGGGSLFLSYPSYGRTGAVDFVLRMGYGFSDRFPLFADVDFAGGHYDSTGEDVGSWMFTVRGQTVLIGDRAGNGLNLNFGVGTGGITRRAAYSYEISSGSALALAGGLTYDVRINPWFALSPEFFVNWHEIPNAPQQPHDVTSLYGLRLNFLWYIH